MAGRAWKDKTMKTKMMRFRRRRGRPGPYCCIDGRIQGRSEDKWYQIFLALGIFPTFARPLLMSEMWGSRPGSTDKGIMGRLSLTTTYDHVPSIWLQKNDFYTTEFHQFPTVIEHFSIDLIFPRIILPLVAILFDVITVYFVAYDIRLDTFLKTYVTFLRLYVFPKTNQSTLWYTIPPECWMSKVRWKETSWL